MRMRLTHEQTVGTRTFYFPLERGPETPPEVTVVIQPAENPDKRMFDAGFSVCSSEDQFEKTEGRTRAFFRMRGKNKLRGTGEEICGDIQATLSSIEARREERYIPGLRNSTFQDLQKILHDEEGLQNYFDEKKRNRKERAAAEEGATS